MKKISQVMLAICLASSLNVVCAKAASDSSFITQQRVNTEVGNVNTQIIAWRRDIHQNPELSNRESRTAKLVADHLRSLGLEVHEGIAKTGVVGILRGGRPGPTVALRADMDALPILEETGLSFASTVTTTYDGQDNVPVMHACGHDAHTAILMGAASVLAHLKNDLRGTVMFVFQPAEEGAPHGEPGGAELMLAEGIFKIQKPDAMFALHVEPGPVGLIDIRQKGFFAGATGFRIALSGEGTHAARPWKGNDLINLGADIVKSLSTITSRQINVIEEPSVVSIGSFQAGNRGNILPSSATLQGTIRTYSTSRTDDIKTKMKTTVAALASNYGAKADVEFFGVTPPTVNDPELVTKILPGLRAAAGAPGVNSDATRRSAAEDFSFFAQQVPSAYYILGSTPNYKDYASSAGNHSSRFDIDEAVLAVGVRAHVMSVLSYSGDLEAQ